MRQAPAGVRFTDVIKVAEHYFGTARQKGSSHVVFKMPWVGLSWLDSKQEGALRGIRKLVADCLMDMKKNGEILPEPLSEADLCSLPGVDHSPNRNNLNFNVADTAWKMFQRQPMP